MSTTNFTISENSLIRKFLEGDNSYIPTSEFLYLHQRPLLRPNFLTEIGDIIERAGNLVVAKKVSGPPINKLTELAMTIGTNSDLVMTEKQAETVLYALREVYILCNGLIKDLSK